MVQQIYKSWFVTGCNGYLIVSAHESYLEKEKMSDLRFMSLSLAIYLYTWLEASFHIIYPKFSLLSKTVVVIVNCRTAVMPPMHNSCGASTAPSCCQAE